LLRQQPIGRILQDRREIALKLAEHGRLEVRTLEMPSVFLPSPE